MVRYETRYSQALWDMLRHLYLDHRGTGSAQMVFKQGRTANAIQGLGWRWGAVHDPSAESATPRGWKTQDRCRGPSLQLDVGGKERSGGWS